MNKALANEILAKLKSAQRICLVVHRRPDPDSLGSAAAIGAFLNAYHIPHLYFCPTELPSETHFFGIDEKHVLDAAQLKLLNPDLICTFDAGDLNHAGLEGLAKKPFTINFDHHSTNTEFGDLNVIEVKSASTTEVIYHFFEEIRFSLSAKMASYLLAGVLIDTDHFFNPATTSSSLVMAGELMAHGVSLTQVRQLLFERRGIASLRLIGEILARLQKNEQYGIAVTHVSEDDLKKHQMTLDDLEGVANILNSIGDAKVMLLLKEQQGDIKVSMRTTKNDVDLGRLAERFGGGGHKKAAGFTVRGTLQKQGRRVRIL